MKRFFSFILLILSIVTTYSTDMKVLARRTIDTDLGTIPVYIQGGGEGIPIVFLHGVYFDHMMWADQLQSITDRRVITIDMPLHGKSKGVQKKWTVEDCGRMLLQVLDSLEIQKMIAVGHSWGSMTILQASSIEPARFAAVGLCNMPFEQISQSNRVKFFFQHLMLPFRGFYTKQAAKSLFGKVSLAQNPGLGTALERSMGQLSNSEVRATDRNVILQSEDTRSLIEVLTVPAMALKGKEDYVPAPPRIPLTLVEGGHISPLEVPESVQAFVRQVINLAEPQE